eukprot:jgi/Hompol1/4908/HPOL_002087-RA
MRGRKNWRDGKGNGHGHDYDHDQGQGQGQGLSQDRDKERGKDRDRDRDREAPSTQIDEGDYYKKAAEFQTWLSEERSIRFGELKSKEARKLFDKFVRRWNKGKLDKKYYSGIQSTDVDSSQRSGFKWKFKAVDQLELDLARDSVGVMTANANVLADEFKRHRQAEQARKQGETGASARRSYAENERQSDRDADRAYRKRKELALDEIVPKETGREAMLERRRMQGAYHRQEREVDYEMSENDLLGSGPNDFQAAVAEEKRQAERRERMQERKRQESGVPIDRIQEYKQKEDATIAMFREMAKHHKLG